LSLNLSTEQMVEVKLPWLVRLKFLFLIFESIYLSPLAGWMLVALPWPTNR